MLQSLPAQSTIVIVTVTPNAALDVTYVVDRLLPAETHRVTEVHERAGGKGINVARVLHALNEEVVATGFLGGRTGAAVEEELARAGVPAAFEAVAGETRRTVAVVTPGLDEATLFNEPGPVVGDADWSRLETRVRTLSADASVVVLSGSLPAGSAGSAYARLIGAARANDVRVLLDADGAALRHGLTGRPDVVKPNVAELSRVLGSAIDSRDDELVLRGAVRLCRLGAESVVVSRGRDGLLCATRRGAWTARLPTAVRGNPTGAGDGAVAALAAALADRTPWPEALQRAAALSAAVVAAPVAGEFDAASYQRHLTEVAVEEIATDFDDDPA